MGIYVCSEVKSGISINLYALANSAEEAIQQFNYRLINIGVAASPENVIEAYNDNFVEAFKGFVVDHLAAFGAYPAEFAYDETDHIEGSEVVINDKELYRLLDVIGHSDLKAAALKYAQEQGWPKPDLPRF